MVDMLIRIDPVKYMKRIVIENSKMWYIFELKKNYMEPWGQISYSGRISQAAWMNGYSKLTHMIGELQIRKSTENNSPLSGT